MLMNPKQIQGIFEKFKQAKIDFIKTVSDLALRPRNIHELKINGIMEILPTLLTDSVPSVQQNTAQALGRIAKHSQELAEEFVKNGDILPRLVQNLKDENRFYKSNSAFVLKSIAKHSPELAKEIVNSQAVKPLIACLEDLDSNVKENAAWALNNIAKHSGELAEIIVKEGAVEPLVESLREPETNIKRVAASVLGNIAKHGQELAQSVVDAAAIPNLISLLDINDPKLQAQSCSCLAHIAKHSVDMAELVVEGELFPKIFNLLIEKDIQVMFKACTCVKEISKHTPELSGLIVNHGGLNALVSYIDKVNGENKIPGIMAIGYIAAFSDTLATSVINAKVVPILSHALVTEKEDHVKAAAAWTIGQIGRHSSEHAKKVVDFKVLPKLLDIYLSPCSEELKQKIENAMIDIIQKCLCMEELYPLLEPDVPVNILQHVVNQFASVLPNDLNLKKQFVERKGLEKIQLMKLKNQIELKESIDVINGCYPEEVVAFFSPNYSKQLLTKIRSQEYFF